MTAILAIDPATATGWAVFDGHFYQYGAFRLTGEARSTRFLDFETRLTHLIAEHQPRLIAYETQDAVRGPHARRLLGGLATIIELVAERTGTAMIGYSAAAIKKAVTGSGKADKQAMIAEIHRRGFYTRDDNEADAMAVLLTAQAEVKAGSIVL